MKRRPGKFVEEKRDTNPVKSFGYVDSDNSRAHWGFWLLQAVGDFRDERKESRRSRPLATEAMLVSCWREVCVQSREQQSFQNLDRRTEERDRSVRRALICRLSRFKNRYDDSRFPYGRDFGRSEREIEGSSEEFDTMWTKMF